MKGCRLLIMAALTLPMRFWPPSSPSLLPHVLRKVHPHPAQNIQSIRQGSPLITGIYGPVYIFSNCSPISSSFVSVTRPLLWQKLDHVEVSFNCAQHPVVVLNFISRKVTPLFKVRLEDVLDRKHLPPLGELHPVHRFHGPLLIVINPQASRILR